MTRYSRLCAMAAIGALLAAPAFAGPTRTDTVSLTGSAPTVCTIGSPTLEASTDASLSGATAAGGTVTFTNFVDTANATYIDGVGFSLDFAGMCNYASKFQMRTQNGNLTSTTPVVGGTFLRSLNYIASLHWTGTDSGLSANGVAGKKSSLRSVAGAFSGQLTLSVSLDDPGVSTPVVAGAFTDQLTIQIGAAL